MGNQDATGKKARGKYGTRHKRQEEKYDAQEYSLHKRQIRGT